MVTATIETTPSNGRQLPAIPPSLAMFTSDGFALVQRIAKAYSESSMVPAQYQGNFANCVIACNMAIRMEADPLMVMQNLHLIHSRPSWSAQYYISALNSCGRYSSIRYEWFGIEGRDDWGCRAWVSEKSSGDRIEGPRVTIGTAKAEGWFAKNGSKWKTMPELMLTYRAAAFFVRTHAPELTMGLPMADEVADFAHEKPSRIPAKTTVAELLAETQTDDPPELEPEPDPEYHQPDGELADPDRIDAVEAFAEEQPKVWDQFRKRLEINRIEDMTLQQAVAACNEILAFREKDAKKSKPSGEMFGGEEQSAYKGGH